MLNYIWAGLIVSSLLFAVGNDVRDLRSDRYRNGQALPVELSFPEGYPAGARTVPVQIRIDAAQYARFYGTEARPPESYAGSLITTQEGTQLRFAKDASLPEPLATIATVSKSNDDELQGALSGFSPAPNPTLPVPSLVRFEPVRFVKLTAISAAAL